jgi:hypothetical protein
MTKREPTCDDCYFRRESLCALCVPVPCPTFRPDVRGRLLPPVQPRLVAREPLLPRAPQPAVA